jgi:hypothetical protein
MDDNEIKNVQELIRKSNIKELKKLVKQDFDIHYMSDYFLYIAVFEKNEKVQKYLINIGLDPEATKGRLEMTHPQDLIKLRQYKYEKEITEYADKLSNHLPKKKEKIPKIKI